MGPRLHGGVMAFAIALGLGFATADAFRINEIDRGFTTAACVAALD